MSGTGPTSSTSIPMSGQSGSGTTSTTTVNNSNSANTSVYRPIEGELSQLEADVLNEYFKLNSNLEQFANITQEMANLQPELLENLRPLEARLGLVLTLFKASVWATFVAKEEEYNPQSDMTPTADNV